MGTNRWDTLYFRTFAQCVQPYFGLIKISSKQILCATPHTSQDVLSFLHAFFFLPTCFSADLPPFCYINQNHFSYFIHTKTSKVTKKKFSDGIPQWVEIFSAKKGILIYMYPLTPSPLCRLFY